MNAMRDWYYATGNQPAGPVPEAELTALLRSAKIGPQTLVWAEGMAGWVAAATVPELTGMTPEVLPPPAAGHAGPAGPGAAMPGADTWSREELIAVARYQKNIQWLVLVGLLLLAVPFGNLLLGLVGLFFIFQLARALRSRAAVLYVVAAFIPLLGLLSLLRLVTQATRVLRAGGIRVGVMGARMEDFERLGGPRT